MCIKDRAIRMRLLPLRGEWWENLDNGKPYCQQIAGRRGTSRKIEVADMLIAERINGTPGVNTVESIETTMQGRQFRPRYTVDTVYGQYNGEVVIT